MKSCAQHSKVEPQSWQCERFGLFRFMFRGLLGLLVFLALPASLFAQRDFSLTLLRTNSNNVTIRWTAQSATPLNGMVIVPQFIVQRSSDLATWTSISPRLSAASGQTLSLTDSNNTVAFYRVQSLIDREYAQLSGAKLASGALNGADFFGAKLFGANFSQANLRGATLSGADIRTANMTRADLEGADLFAVEAASASFDSGSLAGVDASFGDFDGASLFNVDLTGADFTFANLSGADLDFAFFKNVTLDANTLIDPKPKLIWQLVNQGAVGALLTNRDLSFASLMDVNFTNARLNGSDLSGSDFRGADLRGANFTLANMRFVDFRDSLLDATTVLDAKSRLVWQIVNQGAAGRDLHGTNLSSVLLIGANMIGANLTNAIFSSSIMEEINLGSANCSKASFVSVDFFGAILTNANFTQAVFQSADLTNANLRNAVTNGASFSGAIFSNTIMPDGSIRNF